MRRLWLVLGALVLTVSLSGCPVFTRGEPEGASTADEGSAPAEEEGHEGHGH